MNLEKKRIKLFNIDKHISVIHDVRNILQGLGHIVDSWNLSNHTWINNEKPKKISLLKNNRWLNINDDVCKKFYAKYKKLLSNYDGFIHSYPPAFSLLFERFDKPIITISCTRLDYPVFPHNYEWFIKGLRRMKSNGQLISIANNLLDKYYCERETNFEWEHISSLCNYMSTQYEINDNKYIVWTRSNIKLTNKIIDKEFSIQNEYDRNTIHKYKGIIHIPYNLSIMSAFEHYKQNIPIFFPSPEFQAKLWKQRDDILTEVLFPVTKLKFESDMIKLADWYDTENFRGVVLYDGFTDLFDKLYEVDLSLVSGEMKDFNLKRENYIVSKWAKVMEGIS